MRKYIIISLLAAASAFATSCSGFLETAPTSDVSDSQVFTSVKGAQAALNGCYNYWNFGASYDGGRGDDNGYMTHLMTIESRGEDLICDGGWWNFDYQYLPSYNMANSWKNYQIWAYFYTIINNLNSIITFTPDIDGDTTEKNNVLGQAHALPVRLSFQTQLVLAADADVDFFVQILFVVRVGCTSFHKYCG